MNTDTVENREELEITLSDKLGFPVRVDKIANLVMVYRREEVWYPVAEATEQELLSVDNPFGMLTARILEEVPFPPMVLVPKEVLLRGVLPSGKLDMVRGVLGFSTEDGPVCLETCSSGKQLDERLAKNELARSLWAKQSAPRTATIFAIEPAVRTYRDELSKFTQVWCSGAILEGSWAWDQDAKIARRVRD